MTAFKATFVRVTKVDLTVGDFAKRLRAQFPDFSFPANHEMWRKCKDCCDYFDLKKDNCCTSCGSKNF